MLHFFISNLRYLSFKYTVTCMIIIFLFYSFIYFFVLCMILFLVMKMGNDSDKKVNTKEV